MDFVATTGGVSGELVRPDGQLRRAPLGRRRAAPHDIEWLSDNAHETVAFGQHLGLLICTTPVYSPGVQRHGAFVKSFKRDYVYLHRLESADAVMCQLPTWFDDYNEVRPHRGLKMRSPREYLRLISTR